MDYWGGGAGGNVGPLSQIIGGLPPPPTHTHTHLFLRLCSANFTYFLNKSQLLKERIHYSRISSFPVRLRLETSISCEPDRVVQSVGHLTRPEFDTRFGHILSFLLPLI